MDFNKALEEICKSYASALKYPFVLYSRLSDLCGNSYEDKKKIRVLYDVSQRIDIFEILRKYSRKDAKEIIFSKYYLVENIISKSNFEKMIEDVSYHFELNNDRKTFINKVEKLPKKIFMPCDEPLSKYKNGYKVKQYNGVMDNDNNNVAICKKPNTKVQLCQRAAQYIKIGASANGNCTKTNKSTITMANIFLMLYPLISIIIFVIFYLNKNSSLIIYNPNDSPIYSLIQGLMFGCSFTYCINLVRKKVNSIYYILGFSEVGFQILLEVIYNYDYYHGFVLLAWALGILCGLIIVSTLFFVSFFFRDYQYNYIIPHVLSILAIIINGILYYNLGQSYRIIFFSISVSLIIEGILNAIMDYGEYENTSGWLDLVETIFTFALIWT